MFRLKEKIYYVIIILRTIQRIRNQENSTIFILYRKISQKTPKTSIKMKKSKFISVLDVEKRVVYMVYDVDSKFK